MTALNALQYLAMAKKEHRIDLARRPTWVIADIIGANEAMLTRTMVKLARAGIVEVKKGPNGGYHVTNELLEKWNVLAVLEALGNNIKEPTSYVLASERLEAALYDALNISLQEFLQ